MKTITINVPDTVDFDDDEVRMWIVSKLYEAGKLSLGQAAEAVGLSKRAFAEVVAKYGVAIINHSPVDLDRDIANAKSYSI